MQVRTQLAVVAVVAAGWGAGNYAVVHPVVQDGQAMGHASSAAREYGGAGRDNLAAARALSERYLGLHMPQLAVNTIARMSAGVQHDGRVTLMVSRAYEALATCNPLPRG